MQIDWLPATSNHARIRLTRKVVALADTCRLNITCLDPATAELHHFEPRHGVLRECELPEGAPSQLHGVLNGGLQTLAIESMYRDASNYKAYGTARFTGVLDIEDLDLLLTVFWMTSDGFIPHQIGMTDLPVAQEWTLDLEGNDHPWHTVEAIRIEDPVRDAHDLQVLLTAAKNRLKEGWDEVAAMEFLGAF